MGKATSTTQSEQSSLESLSRRERQIMDIVYAAGKASARFVWEKLPDAPTYATVRTLLRVLLDKGHLTHESEGRSFIYSPSHARSSVAKSALQRMLNTFYDNSIEQVVSGLLELNDSNIDADELQRIETLIREHKSKDTKKK